MRLDHRLSWSNESDIVARAYPGTSLIGVPRSGRVTLWVPMRPIPDPGVIRAVLSGLSSDRTVQFLPGGKISQSPQGSDTITPEVEQVLASLRQRRYMVELELPEELFGDGGPVHPKARIRVRNLFTVGLAPEISIATYPQHPHLSTGRNGDSWACPLPPHETDWTWRDGAILDYCDQVALWILKTEVWSRSGEWIGPAVGHDPAQMVGSISPDAPCRCGHGARYRDCHAAWDDLQSAAPSRLQRS